MSDCEENRPEYMSPEQLVRELVGARRRIRDLEMIYDNAHRREAENEGRLAELEAYNKIREELGGPALERSSAAHVTELKTALREIHGIAGMHGFGPLPFSKPAPSVGGTREELQGDSAPHGFAGVNPEVLKSTPVSRASEPSTMDRAFGACPEEEDAQRPNDVVHSIENLAALIEQRGGEAQKP